MVVEKIKLKKSKSIVSSFPLQILKSKHPENPQNGYGRCTLCHCPGYRSRPQKDDICDTCGHNYYKHRD